MEVWACNRTCSERIQWQNPSVLGYRMRGKTVKRRLIWMIYQNGNYKEK